MQIDFMFGGRKKTKISSPNSTRGNKKFQVSQIFHADAHKLPFYAPLCVVWGDDDVNR